MTGGDDVASVGYRVGYDSASQFSREYRRQFGLPPGRDAARMRVISPSAPVRGAGRGPRACSGSPRSVGPRLLRASAPNDKLAANNPAPRNAAVIRWWTSSIRWSATACVMRPDCTAAARRFLRRRQGRRSPRIGAGGVAISATVEPSASWSSRVEAVIPDRVGDEIDGRDRPGTCPGAHPRRSRPRCRDRAPRCRHPGIRSRGGRRRPSRPGARRGAGRRAGRGRRCRPGRSGGRASMNTSGAAASTDSTIASSCSPVIVPSSTSGWSSSRRLIIRLDDGDLVAVVDSVSEAEGGIVPALSAARFGRWRCRLAEHVGQRAAAASAVEGASSGSPAAPPDLGQRYLARSVTSVVISSCSALLYRGREGMVMPPRWDDRREGAPGPR